MEYFRNNCGFSIWGHSSNTTGHTQDYLLPVNGVARIDLLSFCQKMLCFDIFEYTAQTAIEPRDSCVVFLIQKTPEYPHKRWGFRLHFYLVARHFAVLTIFI